MKACDEINQIPQRIVGEMNARVRAQQSNHEGYHLPPCLSHLLAWLFSPNCRLRSAILLLALRHPDGGWRYDNATKRSLLFKR